MRAYPTVDECLDRLRRAGWSVGDVGTASRWVVSGTSRRTGRGRDGVRQKQEGLGIPNPAARVPRWTEEEDDLLRQLPPAEVARRTGRTLWAVYNRRNQLGLRDGRRGRRPPGAPP